MRVDEQNLGNPLSSIAGRAAESQRIQVDSSAVSGGAGAAAADRVDLSGLTGRIAQSMQALASQTAQRVSQLHSDFAAGRYRPDAQQIASAMTKA